MFQGQSYSKILTGGLQLGPYPMEKLKQVDKPTNLVTENIQRIDPRETAMRRIGRGDYGTAAQKAWTRLMEQRDPITDTIRDMTHHLGSIEPNEPATTKAPLPEGPALLSRHIKSLGYFLTADIVGICQLPKSAVYNPDLKGNPINMDYRYAIVIVMQKHYPTVKASQGHDWVADALSLQAYENGAMVAEVMANYIRRLGYPALAQHVGSGYSVLIPPLLLWAGIGEVSRAGIILNPFLGLNYKAAAVLTDMPLLPDKPVDFGLQDFCQRCRKCAQMCPGKAISAGEKVMYNGYETWKLNEQRCSSFIALNKRGIWCNMCVKVCPWTQPNTWPHNLVRWGVQRFGLARTLAIKGDQLWGHTRGDQAKQWWFDLHYQDGVLQAPSRASISETDSDNG